MEGVVRVVKYGDLALPNKPVMVFDLLHDTGCQLCSNRAVSPTLPDRPHFILNTTQCPFVTARPNPYLLDLLGASGFAGQVRMHEGTMHPGPPPPPCLIERAVRLFTRRALKRVCVCVCVGPHHHRTTV
jgi:hypothetical protein